MIKVSDGKASIELNDVRFEWNLPDGRMSLHGLDAALFWLDPSLTRLLAPLAEEIGAPLFRLTVAYYASIGTREDYQVFADKVGRHFTDLLPAWARAAAAAGWGSFQVGWFDVEARRAVVRVRNPWELKVQQGATQPWGCPFLFGKLVGLFSQAVGTNCWAEEVEGLSEEGEPIVDFHLYPSDRTIVAELEALRCERDEEAQRPLKEKIEQLWESQERQRAILASLGEVVITVDRSERVTSYHVPRDQAPFHEPPDQVLGRTLGEALPGPIAALLLPAVEEVLQGEPHRPVSYEREHADEARGYSAKLTALHDATGEVVGVTVLLRDLTERLRVERELSEQLALIERQQEAIRAMSTPILQVWHGVLALPIIGLVDDRRAADITATLLEAVSREQARYAILDLTGVDVIDTHTAAHFARIMRAIGLLGAECLVCGIRPAVAQAMVAFGDPEHGGGRHPRTFGTMQAALQAVIGASR